VGTEPEAPLPTWPAADPAVAQVQLHAAGCRLRAILNIELAPNLLGVVLERQMADVDDLGNLVVALAPLHPVKDLDRSPPVAL
jgi:hypothetical protein